MKVNPIVNYIPFEEVPCGGVIYDDEGTFFIKIRDDIQSMDDFHRINAISIDGNRFCIFGKDEDVLYYPNASLNLI